MDVQWTRHVIQHAIDVAHDRLSSSTVTNTLSAKIELNRLCNNAGRENTVQGIKLWAIFDIFQENDGDFYKLVTADLQDLKSASDELKEMVSDEAAFDGHDQAVYDQHNHNYNTYPAS
ncbi:hypothetical protein B0A55_04751 [Friedmanniomyces simplex]|uniref:Uncharacterized protein n=1 Tax=Friedmanniomyces simplex TaxID=329884 RepID=A0A4U0XNX5_9PEZI|nr:hypothetical protein B0A55_04751 [Friedmanniomyces simplex]